MSELPVSHELRIGAAGLPQSGGAADMMRGWADRVQSLEEQLQSAERERDHWKQEAEGLASEQRIAEQLQEQLQSAETTLAHAEAFIEHQDMSYRWAEWCEGRDPIPASRSS